MNWGHGIALVFSAYVVFMIFMVYQTFQQDFDLVADNYYEQEIKYQEQIDRKNNVNTLGEKPKFEIRNDKVVIAFPETLTTEQLDGEVYFFRSSDDKLDIREPLKLDANGKQAIARNRFKRGAYTLKISWEAAGKGYYTENKVYIQ